MTAARVAALLVACTALAMVLLPVLPLSAQPPTTLRQRLHEQIRVSRLVPWNSDTLSDTWDVLSLADRDPSRPGNVLTIYGNQSLPAQSSGADEAPWNREHAWPRKYGIGDYSSDSPDGCTFPANDLHALFPSEPETNSQRSDLPFDDCVDKDCARVQLQDETDRANWFKGGDDGEWEVWAVTRTITTTADVRRVLAQDGRRGDIARAILYMDVRYEGGVHEGTDCPEPNLVATDDRTLLVKQPATTTVAHMGILSTLLKWHAEDTVDDLERHRNNTIEWFQKNRNPFIDHPEYVCLIWPRCGPAQATPTVTATVAVTTTATTSPTVTATITPTATATIAVTATATATATATVSVTATATLTPTRAVTATATATATATQEPVARLIYLPALAKSTLPTATPPATPPTPAPTHTPENTNVPGQLHTPTPTTTPLAAPDLRIFALQCGTDDEYIIIGNAGLDPVNMEGWSILSVVGSQTFTFPSYTMGPGALVEVHSGPEAPEPNRDVFRWSTQHIWNNDDDAAQLKDPAGTIVDEDDC